MDQGGQVGALILVPQALRRFGKFQIELKTIDYNLLKIGKQNSGQCNLQNLRTTKKRYLLIIIYGSIY